MKAAVKRRLHVRLAWLALGVAGLLGFGPGAGILLAQIERSEPVVLNPHCYVEYAVQNGKDVAIYTINGPPEPPAGVERTTVELPEPDVEAGINTLSNVPAFNWCFGCSATSAAMIAGYYDRTGYPNMYTGPTNGGVMPLTNSAWSDWTDGCCATRHRCPLSATQNGLDGRTSRGHVDDYWVCLNSVANDPYIANGWAEHTWSDCTGDYMMTSRSSLSTPLPDGATRFYYYTDGSAWSGIPAEGDDGGYGWQLFYQSRGYTVTNRYNQYIYGWNGLTNGFTYAQYKAEIDAGRPVMIQLLGHTIVGIGYDDSTNTVYLHDTWDYGTGTAHSMTWGGSYAGYVHQGVTVVTLAPAGGAGTAATFRVALDGTVRADATFYVASFQTGAADVAEWVSVSEPVTAGSVVELDPGHPGSYRLSSRFCAPSVAGVISTEPGVVLGRSEAFAQRALLALTGIVPVKVTNEGGPIRIGDLLVASSTSGHAMCWNGEDGCECALVGKALEPMNSERGLILVLLTAH